MDGFTYNNLFDTKGIEYIIIIAFLILIIPFWFWINKPVNIAEKIKRGIGVLTINVLKIPEGIFHSQNHTWTHLKRSGKAFVGLDDLLLHITGKTEIQVSKKPGEFIRKGELLIELVHENKRLRILSPISGNIVANNRDVFDDPGLMMNDPFGAGWLCEITPSAWVEETRSYYLGAETKSWLLRELVKFKDFLSVTSSRYTPSPSMVMLQDGGELADNALSDMPGETWKDFEKRFLELPVE